ncbi:MAG: 23S rRNA (adenine(2503)-C(2))-methyltransferase RlmN [Clostridia bacterium]|nr:23S rRNA (adenine(2503)-C(2))-methyltransferase RlmN [Clostridia bacterium]
MTETKTDLLSMNVAELQHFCAGIGEPKFRAAQIFKWMHAGVSFDGMTNLSRALRERLEACACVRFPEIEEKFVSELDGTVKYLWRLSDGQNVESVFMRYHHGNTICISTQAGCRMGCAFCASTIGGKVRDLLPSEMLGQVLAAQRDMGERISGIVLMGIGEPLDNYDNVVRFLRLVTDPDGINIGCRHISLSTCGLVDGIDRLAEEGLAVTLSVSLHAPTDALRSEIMPINNKWNVAQLLAATVRYFEKTGRRISFEYTLIAGKNDTEEGALALVEAMKRHVGRKMPIHINLIPVNPIKERAFAAADGQSVRRFAAILERHGLCATVRRTLGPDINASCGQLRNKENQMQKKIL